MSACRARLGAPDNTMRSEKLLLIILAVQQIFASQSTSELGQSADVYTFAQSLLVELPAELRACLLCLGFSSSRKTLVPFLRKRPSQCPAFFVVEEVQRIIRRK